MQRAPRHIATVDLQAVLVGFAGRDAAKKQEQRVLWLTDGAGSMSPVLTVDKDMGVFASTLTMPPVAGMRANVRATLQNDGDSAEALFKTVEVLPGRPATLTVERTGEPSALGVGQMDINVTVRDQHGNLVADGTDVTFTLTGDAVLAGVA